MKLLIVESPGKIKKIENILGINWVVKASMGHFRALKNDGEDNLGFDLKGNRVSMRFEPKDNRSKGTIAELKAAAQKATTIYVATDPDREGEVIAWHLFLILKSFNSELVRVTFNEITFETVNTAIANPRQLNMNLIGSGLARLCLDKLVGFKASPLVWNLGAKSVGRVQSSVLHLICDREREITDFQPIDYFSIYTDYKEGFKAYFSHQTGKTLNYIDLENKAESSRVYSHTEAQDLVAVAKANCHLIKTIEQKRIFKKPPPPLITSSLQQTAGNKLGLSPDRTMKLAQSLYEKGLITYMRTDSVALSEEFCEAAKRWLEEKDPNNVPPKATKFKTSKNSQEAHEAIRPSNLGYSSIKLKQEINEDEFKLYLLIWKRAIASQCTAASIDKTIISIESGDITWKANSQTVQFLGYARYWNDLSSDSLLPDLIEGQTLHLNKAEVDKKRTSPPSRYEESQLVALMEKKGIGRPSTYSSSIKTIKVRKYVEINQKKLFPTKLGMAVDSFLDKSFPDLINSEFTAKMESSLDSISLGEESWQTYLCQWNEIYFEPTLAKAKLVIPAPLEKPKANGTITQTNYNCPICKKNLERYDYDKGKERKSLLRCSDSIARKKSNHKNALFFLTHQGNWWNKEFGQLSSDNIKDCDRSSRQTSSVRLKRCQNEKTSG